MQVDVALQHGGYEISVDFQLRGEYGVTSWENVLEWLHQTDPYPQESQVLIWWNEVQNEINNALLLQNTKQLLKQKVTLAETFKVEIVTLWNLCLDQIEQTNTSTTRFNNVLNHVNTLPNALKNRINKGTPNPANASTDDLKDNYVDHVLLIATTLAVLLGHA